MSGGHFNYIQRQFEYDIIDELDRIIEKNGKKKTKEEIKNEGWLKMNPNWYNDYPEERYHHNYPKEVIDKFKEARDVVKRAAIYVERVDYLLSGDDGEESFLNRLDDELNNLNKPK